MYSVWAMLARSRRHAAISRPENRAGALSGVAANLRRRLAIEENALPNLEIQEASNSIAMIARCGAVLCESPGSRCGCEASSIARSRRLG